MIDDERLIAQVDATNPITIRLRLLCTIDASELHSASARHATHHDEMTIAGDKSYAPPELLYDFAHADFVQRRIGCDLYMLENLANCLRLIREQSISTSRNAVSRRREG